MKPLLASAAAVLSAAIVASGTAVADPHSATAALGWVRLPGAESCIHPQDLAQRVERRLGRSVFVSPSDAELSIEARVERSAPAATGALPTWKVTLVGSTREGKRIGSRVLDIEGESCAAIDDPLALAIAITIDPDAPIRSSPSGSSSGSSPTAAPPTAAPPTAAPPARSPPRTAKSRIPYETEGVEKDRSEFSGDVRLDGGVATGLLPRRALGVAFSTTLEPSFAWPIEVAGGIWSDEPGSAADGGAVFSLGFGGVAICPGMSRRAALRVSTCVGVQFGSMRARGFGFDESYDRSAPWAAASGEVRLSARLVGPIFGQLGAGLLAAMVRPRFNYQTAAGSTTDLFQAGSLVGRLELGLGVHFSS